MEIIDVIEGTSSFTLVLKKKDGDERKQLGVEESGGPGWMLIGIITRLFIWIMMRFGMANQSHRIIGNDEVKF